MRRMMMMEWNQNNISTIASMIAPFVIVVLAKFGINVEQTVAIAFIGAVIELGLLIWSAKNPNEIAAFGNKPTDDECDCTVGDNDDI